jgi:YVTN family beta-propeller protein
MYLRRAALATISLGVLAALLAAVPVAAQFAYIPNTADRTVSVINTANNTVTATISLPETDRIPFGVAVNPSGTRVYVTNTCDDEISILTTCTIGDPGSVSVIDATTNTVIKTISIPMEPSGIAVSPDESRLYVVNACDSSTCSSLGTVSPGSVSVIDIAAGSATENEVIGNIQLSDGPSIGVAVSPDGTRVYVTNLFDTAQGSVSVIDTTSNTEITTIPVGIIATGIVSNPNSPRLYVATSDGISVVNTTDNTLIGTILPPSSLGFLGGLAITPDGTKLYAPDATPAIDVLDATQDTLPLVATVSAPAGTEFFGGLAATPDGSRIYATDAISSLGTTFGNTVSVIQTASNTLSGAPITVGNLPIAFGQFISPASIQGLIDLIESFHLDPGVTNSLLAKLRAALAASKAGQRKNVINQLNALLNQIDAQEGKTLTTVQAGQLETMTNNLIAVFAVNTTTPPQKSAAYTAHASSRVISGIQSLIQVTTNIDLKQGIDTASDPKLQDLQAALAAAQAGETQTALQDLNSFIADTQSQFGSLLTKAQAQILMKAAAHIIALL